MPATACSTVCIFKGAHSNQSPIKKILVMQIMILFCTMLVLLPIMLVLLLIMMIVMVMVARV